MRILVNAANLTGGGGIQKAVEFVRSSMDRNGGHTFAYALSRAVTENLRDLSDVRSLDLATFEASPSRPLSGWGTRASLAALERRFRPDVVYSVFGPVYVRFRAPHLMGFAIPWVTHPNEYAWRTLRNPLKRAQYWALCRNAAWWARFADHWVLETRTAADGLSRVLAVDRRRFHVVPNTHGEPYSRARREGVRPDPRMAKRSPGDFDLLVFSRWYPHKNLELIPAVAAELGKHDPARRYRFFLTFETTSRHWKRIHDEAVRLGVGESVVNLGPIPVRDGPGLYASSDAVFLPTLLETFTATYPEAMCSERPIVTTDMPFAREICGDAALYFGPNDAAGAASQIRRLAGNRAVREELVSRGSERLRESASPAGAYEALLGIIERMAGR